MMGKKRNKKKTNTKRVILIMNYGFYTLSYFDNNTPREFDDL